MEQWELSFGISPQAQQLAKELQLAARCELPLLLLGETGTGKSFVARKVHEHSSRSHGPFVHVDMGAIAPSLFHSEVFGACRGAFTSADRDKPGRVWQAAGGSLFLDEIGNIPTELQAALLVFLDSGRFTPLGACQERQVACRFMAATNSDLRQAVEQGRFRADLLYRLKGCTVRIPALRERPEDAVFFAERLLAEASAGALRLAPETRRAILEHPWPGNLRELKLRLERAVARRPQGVLRPEDLGIPGTDPGLAGIRGREAEDWLLGEVLAGRMALGQLLDRIEKKAIAEALQRAGGRLREAAKLLGIPESSLRSKLGKKSPAPAGELASREGEALATAGRVQ